MAHFILTESSHRWLLSGPDAARYLNGQISNDVNLCNSTTGIAACVCNPKGKLDGIVHVARSTVDGHLGFVVSFPSDLEDTLPLRLEKYLIADDCEWSDITDKTCHIHVTGSTADQIVLDGTFSTTSQFRFGQPGIDVIAPRSEQDALIAQLVAAGHDRLDAAAADAMRIANGAAAWGAELTADTLPKEAGLEPTHVSFTKGCYIGQETISRMKTAGKVRQQLCQVTTDRSATAHLVVGSSLVSGADHKPCGVITSVASGLTTPVDCVGLAMVKRKALESGDPISVANSEGSEFTRITILPTTTER